MTLREFIAAADFVFSGKEWKAMRSPVVYCWVRDGELLYVGMSKKGFQRIFGAHHRMKDNWVEGRDKIASVTMKSVDAAKRLEAEMINNFNPKLNGPRTRTPAQGLLRGADFS